MRKRNAGKGLRAGERKIDTVEVWGSSPHVPTMQVPDHAAIVWSGFLIILESNR